MPDSQGTVIVPERGGRLRETYLNTTPFVACRTLNHPLWDTHIRD
ncbi:MAG: hypothetical protein WBV69_12865 [Candidatus Sulfotelmatobacter sp.]